MVEIGEFRPVNLLGGEMHRSTKGVVLAKGRLYPAGAVLAKGDDGKCVLVDSQTANKTVYAVLAREVDASLSDAPGVGYLTGEFNSNQLSFGGSDTPKIHETPARSIGLYFVDCEAMPE